MSKQTKYIILALAIIVLAVLIYLVSTRADQDDLKVGNKNNNVSGENQNNAVPENLVPAAPEAVAPKIVHTKEITVDFMKSEEKKTMGIPEDLKVQVLERDANGVVLAYKIIRQDSDIMTKFGN